MKRNTVINPGDLILVDPRRCCSGDREITLRVTDVQERFGIQPQSDQYINHLVKGVDVKTDKESWYDFGLIVKILKRDPSIGRLPKNIFRDHQSWMPITQTSATRTGTLHDLIKSALGKLPFEITRPLDEMRCWELLCKNRPGIRYHDSRIFITVKKKTFDGWVSRNYTRLTKTTKELHVAGTEKLLQEDAMMRSDMEATQHMLEEEEWKDWATNLT